MDDDIIRMAREAGLHRQQHNLASNPVQYRFSYDGYEENLERFAALVRAAEQDRCCRIIFGMAGSDNVAQRTVDAIRGKE